MNVPSVDENLYVKTIRNRTIPYDIRHKHLNNQNNRGQKPNITPRQGRLQTKCTVTTIDIPTKPQGSRDMSMHTMSRQISSPTPALQHNRIKLSPRHIGQEKISDILIQINQLDQDSRNAKTTVQSQQPTFIRNILIYTERENHIYNATQNERWELGEGCELSIDAAEDYTEQLY